MTEVKQPNQKPIYVGHSVTDIPDLYVIKQSLQNILIERDQIPALIGALIIEYNSKKITYIPGT